MKLDGTGLVYRDGIWYAERVGFVSYPGHGNECCREIEERSFWFRHRNRCLVSLVQHFQFEGTFLDIGGGNGYVALALSAAGIPAGVLEPGINGALSARARGIDPVICASLEDVDLREIGAAGMFDVLEHIRDETGALRRVHSMLRAGGRLFISVPAYNFLHSADDVAAGHFRRYTIGRLSRALRAANFTVEYTTYLFAPLPPLVFTFRTVPSWFGLRQGLDERQAAEHTSERMAARLLSGLLNIEGHCIEQRHTIPFGTSCIAVATRQS